MAHDDFHKLLIVLASTLAFHSTLSGWGEGLHISRFLVRPCVHQVGMVKRKLYGAWVMVAEVVVQSRPVSQGCGCRSVLSAEQKNRLVLRYWS